MHSGRGLSGSQRDIRALLIAESLQTFSLDTINPIVFTLGDQNKGSAVQQNSLDSTDRNCFRIEVHILAYNKAIISICFLEAVEGILENI
jgi:hypothetical protein